MTIPLEFDYTMDGTSRTVRLFASAEADELNTNFHIHDICVTSHQHALPDIFIRRYKGLWVHTDSLKESTLSRIIGIALEKFA